MAPDWLARYQDGERSGVWHELRQFGAAHLPPTERAEAHAAWLDEQFGPVPLTVLSWVRIVGDVWLVGTHPRWPTSANADPLVVQLEGSAHPEWGPIGDYLRVGRERWREGPPEGGIETPDDRSGGGLTVLPLSPDGYHKANVSGGLPYGVVVPDSCADGVFVGVTTMPFVSYLNWVFRHGGFPGHTGAPEQEAVRRDLAEGLLPL